MNMNVSALWLKPDVRRPVASFTKNESLASIIFCPKNWRWYSKTHVKKNIADRKIIAAGDLFLMKLASEQFTHRCFSRQNASRYTYKLRYVSANIQEFTSCHLRSRSRRSFPYMSCCIWVHTFCEPVIGLSMSAVYIYVVDSSDKKSVTSDDFGWSWKWSPCTTLQSISGRIWKGLRAHHHQRMRLFFGKKWIGPIGPRNWPDLTSLRWQLQRDF